MSELHADSIMKSYGENHVLTDVFVSCKKGEIIGLLGRNGSGKSTLLKVIFGSVKADRRFVKVDGVILNTISEISKRIKYLPQDSFIPNNLKVSKIISHFCTSENESEVTSHPLIKTLLDKKSKQLSGGERRFLEILLIVFSNSKFSFLDEPFNGVAPIYKEEIKEIIKAQAKNKGLIVTDHDYRNVLEIATKIILVFDGGTKIIKDKEELIRWGYIPEN